jgi:hypothetical protein
VRRGPCWGTPPPLPGITAARALVGGEQLLLKQLCERTAELGSARRLAQHFLRLVRERRGRELDEWVADVHNTGPPELRGFSRNLRRDWPLTRSVTVVQRARLPGL